MTHFVSSVSATRRLRAPHRSRLCWRRIVALILLTAALPTAALSQGAPTTPPPPRLAKLDADRGPVTGALIQSVVRGSQAQAAGIEPGNVIVAVNGEPVLGTNHLGHLMDQAERRITIADARGGRRDLPVAPGLVGFRYVELTDRLTVSVSRAMVRDARWNEAVVGAAWALEHGRTQEGARLLKVARSAGAPDDGVARGLAFGVALAAGNLSRAEELLATLASRTDHPDKLFLPGPRERYRLDLARGRSADLVRRAEAHPWHFNLERFSNWPRQAVMLQNAGDPPAIDAKVPDAARLVNPMLYGATGWHWGKDLHTHNELIVENRPFIIKQRPGSYKQAFLTRNDPFGDFDLHARFTVALNGRSSSRYPSTLLVNISDYAQPEPEVNAYFSGGTSLLGVSFQTNGNGTVDRTLLHGLPGRQRIDAGFFDGTTEHTLHLSRRGAWGRIVLDGVTLLQRPVDRDARQLVFHIHLVGLTTEFSVFEITEPRPAR